jgi:toxin ParE1/3/4
MRRIIWQPAALADFDRQIAFIAQNSPKGATLVADRIEVAVKLLSESPIGRIGRVSGMFEFLVPKSSHIIAYALQDDGRELHILRIIHTARNWQNDKWPD